MGTHTQTAPVPWTALVKILTHMKTRRSSLLRVNTTGHSDMRPESYPRCHVNRLAPVWQSIPAAQTTTPPPHPSTPAPSIIPLGPNMVEGASLTQHGDPWNSPDLTLHLKKSVWHPPLAWGKTNQCLVSVSALKKQTSIFQRPLGGIFDFLPLSQRVRVILVHTHSWMMMMMMELDFN